MQPLGCIEKVDEIIHLNLLITIFNKMQTFIKNKNLVTADKFDEIAEKIFNHTVLMINKKEYRICEIEFYLKNKQHLDKYVHGNPDQQKYNSWYFHKFSNGSYKSGTFKGLDIALGDEGTHCGILIRSIFDIEDPEMIEGPCKTVNKILSEYKCDSIQEFVGKETLKAITNKHDFVLKDCKLIKKDIYKGPRIGLSDKYPEYQNKSYR
jgi:3-methyladenine DNA glycosylase Mpg